MRPIIAVRVVVFGCFLLITVSSMSLLFLFLRVLIHSDVFDILSMFKVRLNTIASSDRIICVFLRTLFKPVFEQGLVKFTKLVFTEILK